MSLARHILGRSAVAFGLLVGCASTTSSPATTPRRAQSSPTGYDITMQATACWMGGLWSDALGETGSERIDRIAGRCHQVLRSIVAPDDDYYPLRAVEWRLVDAIARRVQTVAEHNAAEAPSAHDLVALLHAIASASRETIDARRAADVVKEDEEQQWQAFVRAADKTAAAGKLEASQALHDLLQMNTGPLAAEARGVGLLMALDRMEIARGLPKHLKIYAVRTAFRDVFGVPAPVVSDDAPAPIKSGTWLAYLTEVAAAAGHPVPADAHDPQNREPLAWTGVLEGFADQLREHAASNSRAAPLVDIERLVIARIDEEYRGEHVAYEARAPAYR